jgi:hypothetical protein
MSITYMRSSRTMCTSSESMKPLQCERGMARVYHVHLLLRHQRRSSSAVCNHSPCPIVAKTPSAHWHRFSDGSLAPGVLLPWVTKCKATFHIYVPDDLHACPRVVVVCRNLHSHTPPVPAKTPPPLVADLHQLLRDMGWHLADATPRRVMLDSGFVHGLQNLLGWESNQSPSLSDLHPSLANLDHLRRIINTMRCTEFPYKTGFEGMS